MGGYCIAIEMKLLLENIPASLQEKKDVLAECLRAFGSVKPIERILLFGSYARDDEKDHSDVDLCIVAEGAERQLQTARDFRRAIRDIRPKPAFTLIPITPERLAEKEACGDHFFSTILSEGIRIAEKD